MRWVALVRNVMVGRARPSVRAETAPSAACRGGRAAGAAISATMHRQPAVRSLREFVTTSTELNAIAAPAIIGLSSPSAASGIAATL
jgi:hypothetical protein